MYLKTSWFDLLQCDYMIKDEQVKHDNCNTDFKFMLTFMFKLVELRYQKLT